MMQINIKNSSPVIGYAAAELGKYMAKISTRAAAEAAEKTVEINLGVLSSFGLDSAFTLQDMELDDAICIDIKNGCGYIAGSNPKSVVFGVYRYLYELGCRWVRPGVEGEYIPAVDAASSSVSVCEKASYRHRAICIEGAASLEHVLEIVDWMPKAYFSGFFMQFREGYTFFNRWYTNEGNPLKKKKEPISVETAREFTGIIERELERRGLLYHAVGHGWHMEAYGMEGLGWLDYEKEYPPGFLEKVALLKGKINYCYNTPMLVALCYSDPEVQKRLAVSVADYAAKHGNVDYLHIWLDDGYNNKCECERCVRKRPSDFYIQILNLIDEELTHRKLDTRIVFLAYQDLLWLPVSEWFKDTHRFIFMYANCRKDYGKALKRVPEDYEVPQFNFNKLSFPSEVENTAALLQEWKKRIDVDSFIFEYYSFGIIDQIKHTKVVSEDIANLEKFGLNGMVNCQSLREFFPSGIGMETMGKMLWNKELSFDEIALDYFKSAYGNDGKACLEFIESVQQSAAVEKEMLGKECKAVLEKVQSLRALIEGFKPILERNRQSEEYCHSRSWRYLEYFINIISGYADYLELYSGKEGNVYECGKNLIRYLFSIEDDVQKAAEPGQIQRSLDIRW